MIRSVLLVLALSVLSVGCAEEEPPVVPPPTAEPRPDAEVVPPPIVPDDPTVATSGTGPEPAPDRAEKPAEKKSAEVSRLDSLLEVLRSDGAGDRFSAAVELGKLGQTDAVDALVIAVKDDEDTFVRRAAARSLGQLGDDSAVPALIEVLGDREVFVVMSARSALAALTGQKFETAEEWSDWWSSR